MYITLVVGCFKNKSVTINFILREEHEVLQTLLDNETDSKIF